MVNILDLHVDTITDRGKSISLIGNGFVASEHQETVTSMTALFKDIERIVRLSYEYSEFKRMFMVDIVKKSNCSILPNVTDEVTDIEMHHCPLTLYDIVEIVTVSFCRQQKPLNQLIIANEVMELHFLGLIGLVPLSKWVHGLVHEKLVQLHPIHVYGDFVRLFKQYDVNDGLNLTHLTEGLNEFLNRDKDLVKAHNANYFANLNIDHYKSQFTGSLVLDDAHLHAAALIKQRQKKEKKFEDFFRE